MVKKAVDNVKESGENIDIKGYIKRILMIAKGLPVSLEVISTSTEDMIAEGIRLYKMFNPVAKNVYIKIPINPTFEEGSEESFNGIKAIKKLSQMGIPINCTLVFTPEQALMAAKSGASFVSPFAGRIDDYIRKTNNIKFKKSDYFPAEGISREGKSLNDNGIVSGVDLVSKIVKVFKNYGIKDTLVLAASIRNPRQVREVALAGADIATLLFGVLKDLLKHFKTMEGMKAFTGDVVPEYRDLFN